MNKLITKLVVNGQDIEKPDKILEEEKEFFKRYIHDEMDKEWVDFLNERTIKPLNEQQKNKCEGPLTEFEAKAVIRNMINGKTTGKVL